MKFLFALLSTLVLYLGVRGPLRAAPTAQDLQVYFIDVEGGQATLFVTPLHESLLIDTGWAGHHGRDAARIARAARLAGITKLDYVLITHYHDDHVGGVSQLIARMRVGTFIDHGENRETTDAATEHNWEQYKKLATAGQARRLTVKPGDRLPLKGMDVTVVSADGLLIHGTLGSAPLVNDQCTGVAPYPADRTENARSLGVLIGFGALRLLDLGDLTADKEQELMCPDNKLGKIDVYIVSHHGWDQSSSQVLVHAIAPRLAVMDNGEKKGGSPSVVDTILNSPGLEALWQLHYSVEGNRVHNTDDAHIANLPGPDAGHYLLLLAHRDGAIDVLNSRTQATAHYDAR